MSDSGFIARIIFIGFSLWFLIILFLGSFFYLTGCERQPETSRPNNSAKLAFYCLYCRQVRERTNVLWALHELARVGQDHRAMTLESILNYGQRFYNSQKKCIACRIEDEA
jgi:hypothetical protein